MDSVEPLLRVSRVAKLVDCSRTTVYEWVASGVIPHVRIGGSIRIPAADLQHWIDGRTRRGHADPRDQSEGS